MEITQNFSHIIGNIERKIWLKIVLYRSIFHLYKMESELVYRLLENENKHLPPGLVLMEENERLEVLKTLKDSIHPPKFFSLQ